MPDNIVIEDVINNQEFNEFPITFLKDTQLVQYQKKSVISGTDSATLN